MNHCPDRNRLERLLGHQLQGIEVDEIEQHVEGCAACQHTLEELTGARDWGLEPEPRALTARNGTEPGLAVEPVGVTAGATRRAGERMAHEVPTVAGYEITGELGRGGMGVVYKARHVRLNRPCALKMILAGAYASPEMVARFLTEAEAIARLQHPSIVQIRHIGEADGLPFLELEYVAGGSLDEQFDGTPWPPKQAARLAEQVAMGIAEAHRQGIVHRDLKPSNVFLAADGTPKVGDFGLAKMLDSKQTLTRSESVMGSPSYMAPEQARGRAREAAPAVDVYAVGAILYELLTGRPPFRGATALETLEQVATAEPVAPSRLVPGLPRDLETICLKCLEKEPGKRYGSALALAGDLGRFLEGRPVLARKTTSWERFWRWCKRNPGLAALNASGATLTAIVVFVSTAAAWKFHQDGLRIQSADRETRASLLEARMNLFQSLEAQAQARRFSHRAGQRFASLDALDQAVTLARELNLPTKRFDLLRDEAIASMALPDLREAGHAIHRPKGVIAVAFDPTMTRYALRFRDGTVKICRVADLTEVDRFAAQSDGEDFVFRFSPDGRYLAVTRSPGHALAVRDIDQRKFALNVPGPIAWQAVRFSPDGRRVVLCRGDGETLVYDLATGRPATSWRGPADARNLAFRPDGAQIAILHSGQGNATCRIVESESGRLVRSIALPSTGVGVAWGPDGTTLATAGDDSKIYLWEASTGKRKLVLEGATNAGLSAAFHPSGTLLATNGWEDRLRIWDPILGRPLLGLTADPFLQPEFSHDGRIVILDEDSLTTYEVDPALEYRTLAHPSGDPGDFIRASIRHDGRVLAVSTDRGVTLWDLSRGAELGSLWIGGTWYALFESSGDLLTLSRGAGVIQRWPVQGDTKMGQFHIGPPRRLRLPPAVGVAMGVAVDRSGQKVAVACGDSALIWMPTGTSRVGPLDDVRYVALSPDGQWLATGSHVRGAQIFGVRGTALVKLAELPIDYRTDVDFSPDGKWLMTRASPCQLWEPGTGREVRPIGGSGLCFSPDSRLLVVQDANKVILLVEAETGRTLARLESPDLCEAGWAVFSPDGARLVVITNDGPAVHIWDLRAIRTRLAGRHLDWDAPSYSEADPAPPSAPPLPPLWVELDALDGHGEEGNHSPDELIAIHSERLAKDPEDAEAYHHRGHALVQRQRLADALDDFNRAIRLRPGDRHLRIARAAIHQKLERFEAAIADLEPLPAEEPRGSPVRELLASCCNSRAWELATGLESNRNPERALALARRAAELAPDQSLYINTLGVAEYRAGRFVESLESLERSLAASQGQFAGFDLFFMAMAHHRLAHHEQARACFDRAVRWLGEQKSLPATYARELIGFRAEAKAVLGLTGAELPPNVFAPQ